MPPSSWGGPPGPRGSPPGPLFARSITRLRHRERPTWASAAVQGDRPTIYAGDAVTAYLSGIRRFRLPNSCAALPAFVRVQMALLVLLPAAAPAGFIAAQFRLGAFEGLVVPQVEALQAH